jgi:membrane-associated protease RseP (regulator of RpoE activity)
MVMHISALTAVARLFRITVREINFGIGPMLFRRGKVTVRALPLGGWVRFKDTRQEGIPSESPPNAVDDAFNFKPKVVQAAVPLLGALSLLLWSILLRPSAALPSFVHGFTQIIAGAFNPMTLAQNDLSAMARVEATEGFVVLLGILAAKIGAFNLLPLPSLNGGQAILALLRKDGRETPQWQADLTGSGWAILPLLTLFLCWLIALAVYFSGRLHA